MWSESSTSVKQHSVTNFLAFVILTINYSTPTYHLVWLVCLGSIPTCACFHSENFLWLIKLLVLLCNYTKGVSRVLDTCYGRFQLCSNVSIFFFTATIFSKRGLTQTTQPGLHQDFVATATLCVSPTSAKRHGIWNVQTQPNPLYIITQSFPMLPEKQHITVVALPGISSSLIPRLPAPEQGSLGTWLHY